jgi:iron complex transport system substrate-binding protein
MAIQFVHPRLRQAAAIFLTLGLTVAPLVAPAPPTAAAGAEDVRGAIPDTSRLVAIGGSITEIFYALGEEVRLVARDSTSVHPPAALELPDVGYMRALSPEGVLSVNPSGIIALEGSGPREALDVLEKAGVPIVSVPENFDRDGILEKIETVGAVLGVPHKARELAAAVAADVDAAERATDGITERKRVLFILSMQGGKILGSGTGTAAAGIIEMAGGINAITAFDGYRQLSDEAVIAAQPEVILMMDRTADHAIGEAELFAHPALATTPAAVLRGLVRMDGSYLLGFGPRTAGAVRDLSKALYGGQASN